MLLQSHARSTAALRGCALQARPRFGAAAVEFALLVPVLFLLVFTFIEIGRGIMVTHLLTNAARIGARSGIIQGVSTAQITTTVNSYLTANGISGDSATVQVNDGSSDASTAKSGDEITVTVTVPVSQVSWVPVSWVPSLNTGTTGYLNGATLSGQFTLRRE
jgi:Flp pilus assembly protein TadG